MFSEIHLIQKQYLHIDLNGTEAEGMVLQRKFSRLCEEWVMSAIEGVFDRFAPPDIHLCIEKMEIDSGVLTLERLENDLAEAIAKALEKSLREIMPERLSPSDLSGITHKTSQQTINEAFIYFLKTGSLPWSFHLPAGSTLEQVVLGAWQETAQADFSTFDRRNALLQVLADDPVRKRLVCQFSTALLEPLLSLASPQGKEVMDTVLQILQRAGSQSAAGRNFTRLLWETVFAQAVSARGITAANLVGEAWRALPPALEGHTTLANVLEHFWANATIKSPSHLAGSEKNPDAGDGIFIEPAPESPYQSNKGEHPGCGDSIPLKPMPEGLHESDKIHTGEKAHPEAEEGIYIKNAGLALLHPFLSQFFETLGIASESKLLLPERALCLLHFLTTGQTIAPEYELILPKILCNIPLKTPVESDVTLTANDQEEAIALLEAVIRHWGVLRNTSPDGLRGTFLLRSGKVSVREGDWLLQVEQNTWDILLEQLPWGFSMIKLPWMEKMLWVEWR